MSKKKLILGLSLPLAVGLYVGCCTPNNPEGSILDGPPPGIGSGLAASEDRTLLTSPGKVIVQPRELDRIPPGTVIGDKPPPGWSNLVLLVKPRLGQGDVDATPRTAAHYAGMFMLTILANVGSEKAGNQPSYYLDKVALGFALRVKDRNVIATSKQTFGLNLGLIGKGVFEGNEECLKDVLQKARSRTMMVFDAQAIVLRGDRHDANMVYRHAVLVSPADGKLVTLIWLLAGDGKGNTTLAADSPQLLPPNMVEDRVLNVKKEKFNVLGIPAKDAFALVRLAPGTALTFSPDLQKFAGAASFTEETAARLEIELRKAVWGNTKPSR